MEQENKTFVATLLDHATARAFTALLPMSVTMEELNGNEKFYRLPSNLPAHASIPPSIRARELMLFGSNTLVLFYESFSTPYSYTKIGQVDDAASLKGHSVREASPSPSTCSDRSGKARPELLRRPAVTRGVT